MLLVVIALALVACGGSEVSEEAPADEEIVVDLHDIYFGDTDDNVENPPVWRVSTGAEVTVRMENMGSLEHNWAILNAGEEIPVPFNEAQDSDKILFSAGVVAGGESSELTFTAPEPGEYHVLCTIPGHAVLMQGRLVVEG